MTQSESEVTPRSPPGEPLNVRTWPRQARAASRDRVRGGVRRGGAAGLLSAFRVGRVTAGAESRWLRVRAAVGPHGYSKPICGGIGPDPRAGVWRADGSSGILWQIPRPRGGSLSQRWGLGDRSLPLGGRRRTPVHALGSACPALRGPCCLACACPVCERGQRAATPCVVCCCG